MELPSEENQIVEEWVTYATQYGKKVANFEEKTRSAIRYAMEKMLYEACSKATNSAALETTDPAGQP